MLPLSAETISSLAGVENPKFISPEELGLEGYDEVQKSAAEYQRLLAKASRVDETELVPFSFYRQQQALAGEVDMYIKAGVEVPKRVTDDLIKLIRFSPRQGHFDQLAARTLYPLSRITSNEANQALVDFSRDDELSANVRTKALVYREQKDRFRSSGSEDVPGKVNVGLTIADFHYLQGLRQDTGVWAELWYKQEVDSVINRMGKAHPEW